MRARDIALLDVGAAPATQVVLLGRASKPTTFEVELLEEELEVELDAELVLEELKELEVAELELVLEELEVTELDAELVFDELDDATLLLAAEELEDELIEGWDALDPEPDPTVALPPPHPANKMAPMTSSNPLP